MDHEKLLGAASGYAWFQSFEVAHAPYLTETDADRKYRLCGLGGEVKNKDRSTVSMTDG